MFNVPLTLVSYTYNDGDYIRQLLRHVSEWRIAPQRIVIVDDGSDAPFAAPDDAPAIPLDIVRFPRNRGFLQAKSTGIAAAKTKFVLSMDADVILPPDWIEKVVPYAARKHVGIASSPLVTDFGQSLLSQYAGNFFSNNTGDSGETRTVAGGVWLFRKEVWDHVGGMQGYTGNAGEDMFYCERLAAAGYVNYIVDSTSARHVRRMSRHTMAARTWTTHYACVRRAMEKGESLLKVLLVCVQVVLNKMRRTKQYKPEFLYFDVLTFWHALLSFIEKYVPEKLPGFARVLDRLLPDTPFMRNTLISDLQVMGHRLPHDKNGGDDVALRLQMVFEDQVQRDWWRRAERAIKTIVLQDAEQQADFSAYYHLRLE